jgi:hypothetical protein
MNLPPETRSPASVLLALVILLGSCATPPQTRQLQAMSPALPAAVELVDTPFYPQDDYQCGPAALATVLAYHRIEITPGHLVDEVFLPSRHGSLPDEISATARRYGMLSYPLAPALDELLREVAQGNPVLLFQNLGTAWLPQWHFAVLIGYDLDNGRVILRSGRTRRWVTSIGTLERTWSRGNYWARVILPAGEIPVTARQQSYLQAALDLETSGQETAAASAYRSATLRWPENARAWLALGNLQYAAGEYERAEASYRQALEGDPAYSLTWNNLAYALVQTGCPDQAREAAVCAFELAPDDREIQDTLEEITAYQPGGDRHQCKPVECRIRD